MHFREIIYFYFCCSFLGDLINLHFLFSNQMEEILPKAEGFNLKSVGYYLIKISEFERKAYQFLHLVLRQTHRITFSPGYNFCCVLICPWSPFIPNQKRKISCCLWNICISSHRRLFCNPVWCFYCSVVSMALPHSVCHLLVHLYQKYI